MDNIKEDLLITNVYKQNFFEEMKNINEKIEEGYNYIALDTEFPGILYFPKFEKKFENFVSECIRNNGDLIRIYNYDTIKLNVDKLKLIQIGVTLYNSKTEKKRTWQFNIDFNLITENYSNESIELLQKSGINFKELKENGININLLGEYFTVSGLILNTELTWITFHGNYDFAYLLKLLINQNLPEQEVYFINLLKIYFPNYFDLKYLLQNNNYLEGGLGKISKILDVQRFGFQHQAGSDSLLTLEIFLKLKKNYFNENKLKNDINNIWGFSINVDPNQILDILLKNYTFYNYFNTNCYYQMSTNYKKTNGLSYITEKGRKFKSNDVNNELN